MGAQPRTHVLPIFPRRASPSQNCFVCRRVAGISGICGGVLKKPDADSLWCVVTRARNGNRRRAFNSLQLNAPRTSVSQQCFRRRLTFLTGMIGGALINYTLNPHGHDQIPTILSLPTAEVVLAGARARCHLLREYAGIYADRALKTLCPTSTLCFAPRAARLQP